MHDGERNTETVRGRSREKAKRELSHALIKVSEVLGLEPEEGRESRDGWKEFKKGVSPRAVSLDAQLLKTVPSFRDLQIPDIVRYSC